MKKKTAYILGYARSGKASHRFLQERGYSCILIDKKASELAESDILPEEEIKTIEREALFVKSPGIAWNHPLVLKAKECRAEITSEIELGLKRLLEKKKRIFAITGSNGKTTTTSLTAHVLQKASKRAAPCGNVGVALLDVNVDDFDIFVVEISSFQLEMSPSAYFDSAAILNITDNHLDRYKSFSEYAAAKLNLRSCLKEGGKLFASEEVKRQFALDAFSFHDFEHAEKVESLLNSSYEKTWVRPHDVENLKAAFSIVKEAGVSEELFWQAAETFSKPPHRLEYVAMVGGVDFINDSKATSVDAVLKAINSMKRPTVLIAGGVDKGGDYREWFKTCGNKIKAVIAIGQAKSRIYDSRSKDIPVFLAQNLQAAVELAFFYAKEGECVLLSPGCSSYDQFRDYEERGKVFKQLISQLKGRRS